MKEKWGHGYGTEAVAEVVRHGKTTLAWNRIMAGIRPDNQRSIRLVEKIGMSFSGLEPSSHGGQRRVYEI